MAGECFGGSRGAVSSSRAVEEVGVAGGDSRLPRQRCACSWVGRMATMGWELQCLPVKSLYSSGGLSARSFNTSTCPPSVPTSKSGHRKERQVMSTWGPMLNPSLRLMSLQVRGNVITMQVLPHRWLYWYYAHGISYKPNVYIICILYTQYI